METMIILILLVNLVITYMQVCSLYKLNLELSKECEKLSRQLFVAHQDANIAECKLFELQSERLNKPTIN